MIVTKERILRLLNYSSPVISLKILLAGVIVLYAGKSWLPGALVIFSGLFWLFLSFRIVKPAFAGLMFRFGSRVIIGEDYWIKKEGWTFIIPILEKIVQISLRQHQEEINSKKADESEEAYVERAESFSTAEGVGVFPEIFFSYKITSPGKVFELGGGIDENGDSPFLVEMLHDLIIGGARGVLAKMEITKILSREAQDVNGNAMPVGEKIRAEILSTPNFDRLGVELLIIRIEDIKFRKDAQDVLEALEAIKKAELSRQSQVIEADARLQVTKKDAEAIAVTAEANLKKARAEAAGLGATIAAFSGKKVDGHVTPADGQAYAKYQMGLAMAKSLEAGTKVIIPSGNVNKFLAELSNVFDAVKPK